MDQDRRRFLGETGRCSCSPALAHEACASSIAGEPEQAPSYRTPTTGGA